MTTSPPLSARVARDRGFTLVELLVVVIIVGVLAAVAVPVYLNQRTKAYRAQGMQDTRSLAAAYESWSVDHPGQYYPDICDWCSPAYSATADDQLRDLGVTRSPGTTFHAFDMAPYVPAAGFAPGQAYCIEVNMPRNPPLFYYSHTGGFRTSTCQSAH